ncbi:IclR family transcriptional regulator [Vibrio fluvialis]|nr:IclR family transcriptional regulator [Vibrio fluvialis]
MVRREKGSTIERVLQMLAFIAQHDGQYDRQQLASAMGLPELATGKLLTQLNELGMISENLLRKVVAGPQLQQVALAVLRNDVFARQRLTVLEALANEIGETCGISIPSGIDMLYLEKVQTNWPLQINLPEGSRVPLAATASGKLYLATLPQSARRVIMDNLALEVFTQQTLVDKTALAQELDAIAQLGYGRDNGEFIDGMVAVSVPIHCGEHLFGYLFCHCPQVRHSLEELEVYLPQLRRAAAEIGALMQ